MQDNLCEVATVNGTALYREGETLSAEALRQRACIELLRQSAIEEGLLDAHDPAPVDGAISVAASAAIDTLLERALQLPEPTEDACRRYHAAQPGRFAVGERVRARHVLFAVTPGLDIGALRKRAESCLLELRCENGTVSDRFARVARDMSNCPSGAHGGDLGWLRTDECAPEFAKELFGRPDIGVLPHLVHSRFGLHVVEVMERDPGIVPEFDTVREAVAQALRQQAFATALRQYISVLAGRADMTGVQMDGAASPLVQ
ncbi:peptidylprolyl isomerase [bacterium M00.F.Ca.ET.228.01.1.1]|uniref:peptidylprolyl isomerase n=1 Tax=Paraburkholderia phenoliruptrix TaxID=252970 RepID=UPI001092B96F|nr:peptidylprolyl isomerase [Paraburkholderia phenoliruptrix]TGP47368.1 peptidylprolyl isomerase [bacterium M00.F.Ca.ET.228.01.1.1]TGS05160.1 peptidylprolyl isomerase [bacterium M00.F.Ca.ET.191.01.1.1]TGU10096.1 peptidylprolyl isomerase [bacterium M00.F.Ca.ET.155.01.1.1]MBW0449632.1 peptidyl-prolyl cis-trans isomerase [Paraburkholderia phenoliruptrix]MBW9101250.1 peptidyl-prolyl cis-trans isomerase [Paraburkholderia phenoliruptrix]